MGVTKMRKSLIGFTFTLTVLLSFSDIGWAQEATDIPPGPGWLPAVRRHSVEAQRADRTKYKIDQRKLDPHDLTGMWGETGFGLNAKGVPPFTPYGQQLSEATKSTHPAPALDGNAAAANAHARNMPARDEPGVIRPV